jgi:hypothetical protein
VIGLVHVVAAVAAAVLVRGAVRGSTLAAAGGTTDAGGVDERRPPPVDGAVLDPSSIHKAVDWALAHETNPKNLESFAGALIAWGGDPDAAHALLLKSVQLADPHAGVL